MYNSSFEFTFIAYPDPFPNRPLKPKNYSSSQTLRIQLSQKNTFRGEKVLKKLFDVQKVEFQAKNYLTLE